MKPPVVDLTHAVAQLAASSQRAYTRWIERFLHDAGIASVDLEALRIQSVDDHLKPKAFRLWLDSLSQAGLSHKTVQQARSAILWLAHVLAQQDHYPYEQVAALEVIPAPHSDKPRKVGAWLEREQAHLLVQQIRARHADNPALIARDTAIVLLMLSLGLRRGEVQAARWKDYDHDKRLLLVRGKGEKPRVLRLTRSVFAALETWRSYHPAPVGDNPMFSQVRRDGTVLLKGISEQTIFDLIRGAAAEAGLGRLSPHDLRRTFAYQTYRAGASFEQIRQALGHSSVRTTELYINATLQMNQEAADLLDRALRQAE